jgi:hypothetical protein
MQIPFHDDKRLVGLRAEQLPALVADGYQVGSGDLLARLSLSP